MCGIVGFVDFGHKSNVTHLQKMLEVLHHRGPDDEGIFEATYPNAYIGMGHKRLSILDLSYHGHQPMYFDRVSIVYNGEVYNFKEIKEELEERGYRFESSSDTEVILKAYHCWGESCVERLNGMFAIAILDEVKQKFLLLRDRAGVKPLYWYFKENLLLFSSELKSMHHHPRFEKQLNKDALALFLRFQYIPAPHTIFQNCYKLKPGYILQIDLKTKEIKEECYWDINESFNAPKLTLSKEEAMVELEGLLRSSFEYRMVSDVPVGVFLSGGYDSSIVSAILQSNRSEKLKTFTIGFYEKGFDETPYAKEVADYLGTDHTEYYCTQKEAIDIIPTLCEIYDEPLADPSVIPTILVSRLAKKEVTVALSADGGDELFAGYERYGRILHYYRSFQKIPGHLRYVLHHSMRLGEPKHFPYLNRGYNFDTRYYKISNMLLFEDVTKIFKETSALMAPQELQKLFKEPFLEVKTCFDQESTLYGVELLDKLLAIDYKTYMSDDILTKVDRATMSVSLEGREPLLDYRLAEFAAKLPTSFKLSEGVSKYLLKEIAHNYLPKEIMDRPKMGFGVPLTQWFKEDLKHYFLEYLSYDRIEREGIFDPKEVVRLRELYLQGSNIDAQKLWSILIFEMWYERWM